jgi:hypothetical protein
MLSNFLCQLCLGLDVSYINQRFNKCIKIRYRLNQCGPTSMRNKNVLGTTFFSFTLKAEEYHIA